MKNDAVEAIIMIGMGTLVMGMILQIGYSWRNRDKD